MVIRRGQISATAAIAGIVLYLMLHGLAGLEELPSALAGMAAIAALRISAIVWGWTLPVFILDEPKGRPNEPTGRPDEPTEQPGD